MHLQFLCNALLTLSIAADIAVGSPLRARTPYAIKDSFHVPRKWSNIGRAPIDHVIHLQIGVKQGQFDELERHLYEGMYHQETKLSTPSHPRYGQHLTADEVTELVRPSPDALNLVHDWLLDHGVERTSLDYTPAKDWIKVSLRVDAVEHLLNTTYYVFKHEDGSHVVRAPSWSLPKHLHEHIQTIQPTNSFFRTTARKSNIVPVVPLGQEDTTAGSAAAVNPEASLSVASACNTSAVTPLCLRTLYGTKGYTPTVPGQNTIGLTDYLGEANNRSDIRIFLEMFRPVAAPEANEFTVDVIDNGDNQQTPDTPAQLAAGKDLEGNLDAETILALTYPTPLTAFTTGGSPPFMPDAFTPTDTNEPYLDWVNYVLNLSTIPQTISTSYADDEQTVPYDYARRVCDQFAQLGARGVSLLFASGDEGVGRAPDCITNDGTNTSTFLPAFPDSCPFVTSVGATKNFNPEVVAYDPRNQFSSGGGFSNYFTRPSYQDSAVKPYIAGLNGQFNGLYNKFGRGYPDIAAQGQAFVTIWNGGIVRLDGTSASTPTAASILSLVNDALLTAGKPPLGFLNPWLYSQGYKAFTDVTSGSALGCNSTGFPAVAGWDAVTGFGTPYFPKVKNNALNYY